MEEKEQKELELLAAKVRRDVVEMLLHRGYGHLGGSLSIVEVMAVLYGKQLKHDPKNPKWEDRDRLVLSKGHAGPAWYSVLAERGFFDRDMLFTLNDGGTNLPSHPDRTKTPGVDMTTAPLARAAPRLPASPPPSPRRAPMPTPTSSWATASSTRASAGRPSQYIANYKMDNLIVFIDDNKRQLDGWTKDIMNPFDYVAKMQSFGFYTQKVNGQDVVARRRRHHRGQAAQGRGPLASSSTPSRALASRPSRRWRATTLPSSTRLSSRRPPRMPSTLLTSRSRSLRRRSPNVQAR